MGSCGARHVHATGPLLRTALQTAARVDAVFLMRSNESPAMPRPPGGLPCRAGGWGRTPLATAYCAGRGGGGYHADSTGHETPGVPDTPIVRSADHAVGAPLRCPPLALDRTCRASPPTHQPPLRPRLSHICAACAVRRGPWAAMVWGHPQNPGKALESGGGQVSEASPSVGASSQSPVPRKVVRRPPPPP
jgi:hypothetical protein